MKKVLLVLLIIFSFTSVFAQTTRVPRHPEPKSSKEVIIVGKIQFSSSFDKSIEGYRKLFYPRSKDINEFNNIYFVLDDDMDSEIVGMWGMNLGYKNWDINQTFYFDNKPGKTKTVNIQRIRTTLFANRSYYYYFDLPLNIAITCPPGAQYIYIGTFEYDVDYSLRPTNLRHIDEYEKTKEEMEALYGKEINLVRGDFYFRQ